MSEVLGKNVEAVNLPAEELSEMMVKQGIPREVATVLGQLDAGHIANGGEEKESDAVARVGKVKPTSFTEFAENNKAVWA